VECDPEDTVHCGRSSELGLGWGEMGQSLVTYFQLIALLVLVQYVTPEAEHYK
jgi:hypothetical protein